MVIHGPPLFFTLFRGSIRRAYVPLVLGIKSERCWGDSEAGVLSAWNERAAVEIEMSEHYHDPELLVVPMFPLSTLLFSVKPLLVTIVWC